MNKKFLSAILFGALMVSSTGTFVSCKDYDDDIDQINKELTDIKSAIAALQAKVDGGKYVTNVVKNGNGITVTWNDNSTSTIETIKGDKGENGKDGTVVTIVDGFWAFDGVKSEYPAKGDKGDKGDKGEAGTAGAAAAAGHDAKISEDGYWMVWNAEKGEYTKTEYIAGGATAVKGEHGWTIRMKDEKGNEQSIYIPNSADLVSIESVFDGVQNLDIYYGLVNTAVDWTGAKAVNGKMETGMYPTLEEDVKVMLNPTGVDGTAYKFDFRASDNKELWGLTLSEIEPYAGAKLTRTASESGVWVLPRDIQRVPLNELNERADYVTQFKQNDGSTYAFALNATSKESSNVIKSQYIYTFDPINIGSIKASDFRIGVDQYNYVWNQEHKPNFSAWEYLQTSTQWRGLSLSQVIYDYKLEIDKTRMTQVNIDKYGLKITEDGYRFIATKEAAVDNIMYLKVNYILVNGSKASASFSVRITAKDLVVVDSNIGTINSAFNAAKLGTVAARTNATLIPALDNKFVYGEKTEDFDVAEKLGNNYDEWIDAMYQGLNGRSNTGKANFLKQGASIIGGAPINNDAEYNHTLIDNLLYFDYVDENGKSCIYDVANDKILEKLAAIKALKVYFVAGTYAYNGIIWDVTNTKPVKAPYYTENGNQNWGSANGFAIPLNNAFRVQVGAAKEEQTVAALNFTFQLTQPDINKVGIVPQNDLFNLWEDETTAGQKTADVLWSFGAYNATKMGLPLYGAFNMWTASGANLYSRQNNNAQWYKLSNNNPAADGVTLLGGATPTTQNQTQNPYQISWTNYNTTATASGNLMTNALLATPQKDASINVDIEYHFFGVYRALPEQLPFYSTGTVGTSTYQEHPGFRLKFASTIKKATLKTKEDIYYAKAGTHHVFISNDDIIANTKLGKEFVLLDGLNAAGVPETRKNLNDARGFDENIRPFDILTTYAASSVNASGATVALPTPIAGTLQTGTTVDNTGNSAVSSGIDVNWNVNIPAGTVEPALDAPANNDQIKIYTVQSRQKFPVGNTTYPSGLPAVEGGYVIQLGEAIDYRQPVYVTFTIKDKLGFTNTLTVKVQKLQ